LYHPRILEKVYNLHLALSLKGEHGRQKMSLKETTEMDSAIDELCEIMVEDCPICGHLI